MNEKLHIAANLLVAYSHGWRNRLNTIQHFMDAGYSEQTAIFILDILEQPDNVTEALDEILAPDPPPVPNEKFYVSIRCPHCGMPHDHPHPNGGNPNDKT